ncbi:hypothetical protein ACJMK2_027931 [Sinanodonta woodiana]|uniref:Forkhead box protein O n=1 Tax=Sinanodonta woodiana TaxID=1069815 RepID=A0ABD3X5H3_SINWO
MDAQVEIDPNFEPQIRARSNTWPCRPREDIEAQSSPASIPDETITAIDGFIKESLSVNKKTSSRRNAWGNLSYADLITKAIQSSPDQRLTLSQIYDWMVQNVPYFKDKGDNTSSAGWKNSIRHNLSLHSRFMRIQNEGTGKSSWWVINPDAKPGKAPRRRAGSMETKSYEKKRGRVKKRIEALCAQAHENNNSMSNDDFLENPLHTYQLSPEFRPRASSNASSCGRLSPIQAGIEPDLHDNQVPPMSPIPWGSEIEGNFNGSEACNFTEDLVETFMKLGDSGGGLSADTDVEMLGNNIKQEPMSDGPIGQYSNQSGYDDSYGTICPPSYSEHVQQHQQNQQKTSVMNLDQRSIQNNYSNMSISGAMALYGDHIFQDRMTGQQSPLRNRISNPQQSSQLGIITQQQQVVSPGRSPQISPSGYPSPGGFAQQRQQSTQSNKQLSPQPHKQQYGTGTASGQSTPPQTSQSILQRCLEAPNDSLLRAALTQKVSPSSSPYQQQPNQTRHQQYTTLTPVQYTSAQMTNAGMNQGSMTNSSINRRPTNNISSNSQQNMMSQNMMNGPTSQQHISSSRDQFFSDQTLVSTSSAFSEIDTENLLPLLDYEVEQMLQQELSMEDTLDFNFESVNSGNATSSNSQNLVR